MKMDKLILPLLMYKESGSERKGTKKSHYVVPTWNHLYQIRNSRKFLDKWALQHKEKIEILTLNWIEKHNWKKTIDRKIYVDVWVFWPDARERDCHNIDKILMDAFEDAGIYDNDTNALLRFQDFEIDMESPRIEVLFTVGDEFNRKEIVKEQRKIKKEKDKKRKSK